MKRFDLTPRYSRSIEYLKFKFTVRARQMYLLVNNDCQGASDKQEQYFYFR